MKTAMETKHLEIITNSEVNYIGQVVEECLSFLDKNEFKNLIDANVVLRELLRNAIVHGNKIDGNKKVKVNISFNGHQQVVLDISDEGNGFEFEKVNMKLPDDPKQLSPRGLAIVNALVKEIDFSDSGNRVKVVLENSF